MTATTKIDYLLATKENINPLKDALKALIKAQEQNNLQKNEGDLSAFRDVRISRNNDASSSKKPAPKAITKKDKKNPIIQRC
jgi:hypothetical protein